MSQVTDQRTVGVATHGKIVEPMQITVLSGGVSTEREVSLKSGQAVCNALRSLGHHVQLTDIKPESLEALEMPADVMFIALHGSFGEDGRLQKILDSRKICYTGSGPTASALAMDKVAAKCRFIESNVPTPRFDVITGDRIEKALAIWNMPVVVKPIAEGSSVDCQIIHERQRFSAVLKELCDRYGRCLVEQYIHGPELTVGVLGERALPPIQICTQRDFYNYQAKYDDNSTEYLFDIDLPLAVIEQVQALSLKAHQCLGCRDFSRVDWMIDAETHQPYALEVNTIPGFTDHSLLPKAAARAGYDFSALCQAIVEMACARS